MSDTHIIVKVVRDLTRLKYFNNRQMKSAIDDHIKASAVKMTCKQKRLLQQRVTKVLRKVGY